MLWLNKTKIALLAPNIGIQEAYIEKDLHVINVLKAMEEIEKGKDYRFIFGGGTSISKGYQLTNRFSEDIDFLVVGLPDNLSKNAFANLCKKVRKEIIVALEEKTGYTAADGRRGDRGLFYEFHMSYDKIFDTPTQLRQDLKIELSFKKTREEPILRKIESYFCQYDSSAPAVDFPCVAIRETAANKITALLWRVTDEEKSADIALTRHLYDLSAIKPHIMDETLIDLTKTIFDADDRNERAGMPFDVAIERTINELQSNPKFAKDYAIFVDRMVYNNSSKIPFDKVLEDFREIIEFIGN
jgi:predicted nucleotidyltransferase component of viral defense system